MLGFMTRDLMNTSTCSAKTDQSENTRVKMPIELHVMSSPLMIQRKTENCCHVGVQGVSSYIASMVILVNEENHTYTCIPLLYVRGFKCQWRTIQAVHQDGGSIEFPFSVWNYAHTMKKLLYRCMNVH